MHDGLQLQSTWYWDCLWRDSDHAIGSHTVQNLARRDALMKNERNGLGHNRKRRRGWFVLGIAEAIHIYLSKLCSYNRPNDFPHQAWRQCRQQISMRASRISPKWVHSLLLLGCSCRRRRYLQWGKQNWKVLRSGLWRFYPSHGGRRERMFPYLQRLQYWVLILFGLWEEVR